MRIGAIPMNKYCEQYDENRTSFHVSVELYRIEIGIQFQHTEGETL